MVLLLSQADETSAQWVPEELAAVKALAVIQN